MSFTSNYVRGACCNCSNCINDGEKWYCYEGEDDFFPEAPWPDDDCDEEDTCPSFDRGD